MAEARAETKFLIKWLNDAYGMEKSLIPVLENHAKDSKNLPELQQRIEQHIEETKRHAETVKGCIEKLGGSVSSMKSVTGSLMGSLQSISTGAAEDETVKNGIQDYTAEHFEMASYRAIIDAAEKLGEPDVAEATQGILAEEEAMATFLEENSSLVLQTFLEHELDGVEMRPTQNQPVFGERQDQED